MYNMPPFKSTKQKKFLYANKPALAKRWSKKYGNKIKPKNLNEYIRTGGK